MKRLIVGVVLDDMYGDPWVFLGWRGKTHSEDGNRVMMQRAYPLPKGVSSLQAQNCIAKWETLCKHFPECATDYLKPERMKA